MSAFVYIHNGGNQDVVQILFEVHLSMVSQPLKNIQLKEMSFEPIIDHFKYQHENCIWHSYIQSMTL